MISTTRPAGLASVDRALAATRGAQAHNEQTHAKSLEAREALQGYQTHVDAIFFDRPDRDVSQHGRQLRSQADLTVGRSEGAGESHELTQADLQTVKASIDSALKEIDSSEWKARNLLTQAQSDLKLTEEISFDSVNQGLKAIKRDLGDRLEPYLTEVEEDAPGRDVGRFADRIGERFSDGRSDLNSIEIGSRHGGENLQEVLARLQQARAELVN